MFNLLMVLQKDLDIIPEFSDNLLGHSNEIPTSKLTKV